MQSVTQQSVTCTQQLTMLLSSSLCIPIIKHRNHWFFIALQMTLHFVTKLYIYDTRVWTYSMDVKCNLKMYGNIQFNHKGVILVSSASSSFKHISNSHVPPRERGSSALLATLTHHFSHKSFVTVMKSPWFSHGLRDQYISQTAPKGIASKSLHRSRLIQFSNLCVFW